VTSPTTLEEKPTLDRKVSVAISMPQSLLADIDKLKGDIPRSIFVSRALRAKIQVGNDGGRD
jgi:hypothetical protein